MSSSCNIVLCKHTMHSLKLPLGGCSGHAAVLNTSVHVLQTLLLSMQCSDDRSVFHQNGRVIVGEHDAYLACALQFRGAR